MANVRTAAMIWFRVNELKNRPIATNIIPIVVRPTPSEITGPRSKRYFPW